MKPNKPLLRKWVKALRSGAYHQTKGALCKVKNNQTFHCCLGVACRVAIKNGIKVDIAKDESAEEGVLTVLFNEADGEMPEDLRQLFGISEDMQTELVEMNDTEEASFREIADHIEKSFDL